ncbi:Innexin unc-9 [Echinococcus granulosus]|uniref:Innexin n=1 Tax=Echinococcus granulosus TaxID=6210 RepID=W6UY50_ECHGR|nr:Innexin unc-9 [Echinococcus granulosus]EUB58479.1 Innexin unc-9 [Echinococcus granulosus]
MIESTFLDYLTKFKVTTYAGVEDFADKFNFIFTVIVLSLCTVIITAKSYLLKPIACYISTEVGGTNLLNYVENYCWVQGTIPISYASKMPQNDAEWAELENVKILYYQWVPFVLGLQCCLFYTPRLIWQAICYNRTGTDLENLVNQAMTAMHSDEKSRQSTVDNIAEGIEHLLFQGQKRAMLDREASRGSGRSGTDSEGEKMLDYSSEKHHRRNLAVQSARLRILSKRRGNYIVLTYLLIKVLYLANAVGQMFLMQHFLGFNSTSSPLFGISVLKNIINGHDWQMTQIFPRVGFCYAEMKILGVRVNGVTAQCALPVNMLNEKLYIFLWWWILAAAIITAIYLLLWIVRICARSREVDYIIKYIRFADDVPQFDERDVDDFALRFLRHDGIFLIRMVRMNAGDVVAAGVVNALWNRYQQRLESRDRDPLTNNLRPNIGWSADLEKGGDNTTVRNRAPEMASTDLKALVTAAAIVRRMHFIGLTSPGVDFLLILVS